MFREVLSRIFDNVAFHPEVANITAEGDLQEQVVAFADVRVEPMEPVEGEEFRIFANIRTHQVNIKILFVSALDAAEELTSILPGIKFDDVIRKPVNIDHLINKIKSEIYR